MHRKPTISHSVHQKTVTAAMRKTILSLLKVLKFDQKYQKIMQEDFHEKSADIKYRPTTANCFLGKQLVLFIQQVLSMYNKNYNLMK